MEESEEGADGMNEPETKEEERKKETQVQTEEEIMSVLYQNPLI